MRRDKKGWYIAAAGIAIIGTFASVEIVAGVGVNRAIPVLPLANTRPLGLQDIGQSPLGKRLCQAIQASDLRGIEATLRAGYPVDAPLDEYNALEYVLMFEPHPLPAARLLFHYGANIDGRNPKWRVKQFVGVSPLAAACMPHGYAGDPQRAAWLAVPISQRIEVVRFLIHHGAHVNLRFSDGSTALFTAVASSDPASAAFVRTLLDFGAKVNVTGREGITPLYCAERVDIVDMLLHAGARIDAHTRVGETPLMKAVRVWNYPVVQELIRRGASLHVRDMDGNNLMAIAVLEQTEAEPGIIPTIKLLHRYGVKASVRNNDGMNAAQVTSREIDESSNAGALLDKWVKAGE